MPLTSKGEKIKSSMESEYGPKKGEQVFYASKNKGTISGVDVAQQTWGVFTVSQDWPVHVCDDEEAALAKAKLLDNGVGASVHYVEKIGETDIGQKLKSQRPVYDVKDCDMEMGDCDLTGDEKPYTFACDSMMRYGRIVNRKGSVLLIQGIAEDSGYWFVKGKDTAARFAKRPVAEACMKGLALAQDASFQKGEAVVMSGSGKIGDVIESDEDMTLVDWRSGQESRVPTGKLSKFTSMRAKDAETTKGMEHWDPGDFTGVSIPKGDPKEAERKRMAARTGNAGGARGVGDAGGGEQHAKNLEQLAHQTSQQASQALKEGNRDLYEKMTAHVKELMDQAQKARMVGDSKLAQDDLFYDWKVTLKGPRGQKREFNVTGRSKEDAVDEAKQTAWNWKTGGGSEPEVVSVERKKRVSRDMVPGHQFDRYKSRP